MPLCKLTRGFLEFRSGTFLQQRTHFEHLAPVCLQHGDQRVR